MTERATEKNGKKRSRLEMVKELVKEKIRAKDKKRSRLQKVKKLAKDKIGTEGALTFVALSQLRANAKQKVNEIANYNSTRHRSYKDLFNLLT